MYKQHKWPKISRIVVISQVRYLFGGEPITGTILHVLGPRQIKGCRVGVSYIVTAKLPNSWPNTIQPGDILQTEQRRGRICPSCDGFYLEPPAISRKDNQTPICPDCGTREALEAFMRGREEKADE